MSSRLFRYFLFLIVLTGICLIIGYGNILFYRPQSIHQWTQCDRASVAYNYYANGFHFFKPQVHNISNGTGITGIEFPIINFITAIGYAAIGFHEYIYRLLIFAFLLIGLLNAYRLADLLMPGKLIAALPVYLLFVSPVLAYYGICFLSDPAGLGLSLSAWYYFLKWKTNNNKTDLKATVFLCSLAGLVKISSLINPLAMASFLFLQDDSLSIKTAEGIKKKILRTFPIMLSLIPVFAWYYYATWLNKTYDSKVLMLEMRPVKSWDEFIYIWNTINDTWLWWFYPKIYFITLLVASAAAFFIGQKPDKDLLTITLLLYAGAFSFFLLMFTQFRVHDYYVISMMPAFFFHWLLIIKQFTLKTKSLLATISLVLLLALTCYVTAEARDHFETAYDKTSWKYGSIVNDRYFFFEPELRKLNIHPDDGVVSIFDVSFNITLYLMNQRGITIGPLTPQKDIIKELRNPAYKYAILNNFNPTRFDPVMDSLQLGKKILEWNDLTVYRLPSK